MLIWLVVVARRRYTVDVMAKTPRRGAERGDISLYSKIRCRGMSWKVGTDIYFMHTRPVLAQDDEADTSRRFDVPFRSRH